MLSFVYMMFLTGVVFNSRLYFERNTHPDSENANKRMIFISSLSKALSRNDNYVSRSSILSLNTHGKKYDEVA